MINKKLKTLKDIKPYMHGTILAEFDCAKDKIKQEAIKWIKHFNSENGDYTKDDDWLKFTDSGYDEYASHAYGNVIEWIKHFFNISEEDLK